MEHKITIITITYNCRSVLQETINSVINQTYQNIEYIIVDGGSTDGTIEVIKHNVSSIFKWISESDNGIYDAMNKGIDMASGEYVNFMNAGDVFTNMNVISDIFSSYSGEADVIYGDSNIILETGKFLKKSNIVSLANIMPFIHQASFTRLSYLTKYKFDLSFKLCSDRNLFKNLIKDNAKFTYMPIVICDYENEEGLSSKNIPLLMYEIGIVEDKTNTLQWKVCYYSFLCTFHFKSILKHVLPRSLVLYLKKRNMRGKQPVI